MSRRKIRRIALEAAAAFLLIFALVFFVGFRATSVKVQGNKFYSEGQIKKMVLDAPIAKNTILAMLIKTEEKTKDAQMIENVVLKRINRNTLGVQVKEKQMIGCIQFEGRYVNFDRQGMIQIITDEPLEDVPLIDGLDVKEAKQGEKLKGINTRKLNTILSVGKMLEKTERKPDRLVFNEMNQLVLYYEEIEARLGNDENMDEKMNRLVGILPNLEGMKGILHLENITENTESVVFDKAETEEEDQGEDSETEEEIKTEIEEGTEEDTEGAEDTATFPEDEESADRSENQRDSEEEGGDREGAEDRSSERSDVEYSDGEDAAEF